MKIFRDLGEVPAGFGPSVVTVGNFDGVHRAHQHVLGSVVAQARAANARAVAVTFEPHPTRILRPELAPKLITPGEQKLRLLAATGIDALLIIPFSRDLSLMPPRDFARRVLAETLRATAVHEGANFHFGHKAEGNVERLTGFGRDLGFHVVIYPEIRLRGEVVSSSNIRNLLQAGRVGAARHLLGRAFSLLAHPGRGRGYGHKYTVPTINLERYDELVPANGVYITAARVGEERFDAVTNVGVRPTFGPDSFAVETHLLNFHPVQVTAETEVEFSFLYRLRDEQKWPDVEALRAQIAKDVRRARRYFHWWRRLGHRPAAEP